MLVCAGLFSTRTPHRPNPIGLSIVKIDRVDMASRTVFISGLDLVDGTPVLDIKPYIPVYDSQPQATFPEWIRTPAFTPRPVTFSDESLVDLESLKSHLRFFTPSEYMEAMRELLPLDIRSIRQGRGHATGLEAPFRAQVDTVDVHFVTLENEIRVMNFTLAPVGGTEADNDEQ